MNGMIADVTLRFTTGRTAICVLAVAMSALSTGSARASLINVELRTTTTEANIGERVDVEMWFVSAGASGQEWIAADVWVGWDDAAALDYLGRVDNPALPYGPGTPSISPVDPLDQLRWGATSQINNPIVAEPPSGTLVTTFQFEAVSVTAAVEIFAFQPSVGPWTAITDGLGDLTGTLGGTSVEITPEPATVTLLLLGGLACFRRRGR